MVLVLMGYMLLSGCETECEPQIINNTIIEEVVVEKECVCPTCNDTIIETVEVAADCTPDECPDTRTLQIKILGLERQLTDALNMTRGEQNLTKKIEQLEDQIESFDDRAKAINDKYRNCSYYQDLEI